MKQFRQFLKEQRKNPIPVGKYDSDVRWNVDHLIEIAERKRPKVSIIDPKSMVDSKELFATQTYLDSTFGGGDPVIEDYDDKPVVVEYKRKFYILDGHHRISDAYLKDDLIEVYLFR